MEAIKIEQLFSVRGKIALGTGGSRGLGEVIARAYVENDARVYVSSRKEDVCKAVAKALPQYGECIDIPADLTRINEVDRLASEIEKERASTTKYGSRQKLTLLIRADE